MPAVARRNANSPATPAQIALVSKLARELYGDDGGSYMIDIAAVLKSRYDTSELIDTLIAESKAARAAAPAAAPKGDVVLPEPGYYATDYQGVLRFYAVRAGKGRHEGRRFLNRFRSEQEDRVFRAEQEAFAAAVEGDGLVEARMRFATELVRCFTCGRMLTDELSRSLGQGPDCRGRA